VGVGLGRDGGSASGVPPGTLDGAGVAADFAGAFAAAFSAAESAGVTPGMAVLAGALRTTAWLSGTRVTMRPRDSASSPTAAHAAIATVTHAFPARVAKRCCASQRNIFDPARHPAAPMMSSASRSKRAVPSPAPMTHACSASTA
jgi:hypothetical protein